MLPSFSHLYVCKNCVGGACRARVTTKLSQKFPDPKEAERFYIECEAEIPYAGSKSPWLILSHLPVLNYHQPAHCLVLLALLRGFRHSQVYVYIPVSLYPNCGFLSCLYACMCITPDIVVYAPFSREIS